MTFQEWVDEIGGHIGVAVITDWCLVSLREIPSCG